MTGPLGVDSHCTRCLRAAPSTDDAEFNRWEALDSDGLIVMWHEQLRPGEGVLVCPDCLTADERQELEDW